ncbi:MAG: zf-HC2 domain-containing protein [Rubrobacter sp.]|nr:zf-HC2 domain-containing protein [Rubrobacter sp.]
MNDENCRRCRGLLGVRLLGGLEPAEEAELEGHLESCPECRAEEAELRSVAELLGEPGSLDEEDFEPPPDLKEKVVGKALGGRPRRVPPIAAAAAALAVVAIGVAALFAAGLPSSDDTPGLGDEEPISFGSPPRGVTVEASVVAHTWGTELLMDAEGLETGEVYTVSIEKEDGESVPTGTFIGTDEKIDCALNAAVLRQNAESVTITDSSGEVVMRSNLEDRPPSLYT